MNYKGGLAMESTSVIKKRRVPHIIRITGLVILGITAATLFALMFGWLVMLLWNKLLPSIFNITSITYWQAVGLVILTKLLFGGFGPSHADPSRHIKKHFRGFCNDDQLNDSSPGKSLKYYDQYWQEEGKQAYEAYLEKKGFFHSP